MALRMMQIVIPAGRVEQVMETLADQPTLGVWEDEGINGEARSLITLLIDVDKTEPVMDQLESRFGHADGFHVILSAIEAVLPRMTNDTDEDEADAAEADGEDATNGAQADKPTRFAGGRISREELYQAVHAGLGVTPIFLVMAALSAVVAAFGLLQNDVAVLIGAMVFAPLLAPNVALSLATTLGDPQLLRRAAWMNFSGIGVTLGLAALIGLLVEVDPTIDAIAGRTHVELVHLALALASGTAGTLAYTRGLSAVVIGVMVAVALVPPLAAGGLLLGSGQFTLAGRAMLLVAANVICINLAGTVTFLIQGVRPRRWWEAERARKAAIRAAIAWLLVATALGVIVYFTSPG